MIDKPIVLADRHLIRLSGDDLEAFLGALVTSELPAANSNVAVPSALLTPQGKIQFAFLLMRDGNDILVDCHADTADDLTKRLKMYRLRAKVAIDPLGAEAAVCALGASGDSAVVAQDAITVVHDRRSLATGHDLGYRACLHRQPRNATPDDDLWREARVAAGVLEFGDDYATNEVFPTEVNLDRMGGVSYTKGCFVGQEVVSRMHHRGTERRRSVLVTGLSDAAGAGDELRSGDRLVGKLMVRAKTSGLAIVRLDRLAAEIVAQTPLAVRDAPVNVHWPDWLGAPTDFISQVPAAG